MERKGPRVFRNAKSFSATQGEVVGEGKRWAGRYFGIRRLISSSCEDESRARAGPLKTRRSCRGGERSPGKKKKVHELHQTMTMRSLIKLAGRVSRQNVEGEII